MLLLVTLMIHEAKRYNNRIIVKDKEKIIPIEMARVNLCSLWIGFANFVKRIKISKKTKKTQTKIKIVNKIDYI